MRRDLAGKVAWITGAGTGIGRAGAEALAAAGMTVVLSGRRRERLEAVAEALGGPGAGVEILPLDVADAAAVDAAAESIRERHGRIDVLVASAGLNVRERSWADVAPEGWEKVIDADLNGAFYCCRAVLPAMREQGEGLIVNVSSWAGRHETRLTGPAYTAAKHGLGALTETINMEECVNGIRACSLEPGEVATEILDTRPQPPSEEDRARMIQPEDMGAIIRFLAELPAHVCINSLLVSPTWNRGYVAALGRRP